MAADGSVSSWSINGQLEADRSCMHLAGLVQRPGEEDIGLRETRTSGLAKRVPYWKPRFDVIETVAVSTSAGSSHVYG
jgi:hypothetical protein